MSLLYFLFGVLRPFACDSRPQSIGNVAQQVRQTAAHPAAGPAPTGTRPPASPPEPAWLKIFVSEFEVAQSPRLANYDTKGQVSRAFHKFYSETLRWAKVWQAKREADQ